MARPQKSGLDYFALDVKMDDAVNIIEAEHGLVGFAIIIKLFQRIYNEGYYYKWTEKEQILFSSRVSIDRNLVTTIVEDCIKWGIFNQELYENHTILTSRRIQNHYLTATYKRVNVEMVKEYLLIDVSDRKNINVIRVSDDRNPSTTKDTDDKSTQSKVKESKEKESKENNKEDEISIDEIPIDEKPFNYLEYHTYYDLVEHAKKEESWFNSLLRLLKLEKETILSELENFPIVQEAKGNKVTNLKDFKNHFFNYMNLRKDDLRKVERKKSEISIVDRLEIERQKYFEILKKEQNGISKSTAV